MKTFPNDFTSWIETFYEVVSKLNKLEQESNNTFNDLIDSKGGIGGMYEFAEDLTDEFENLNENREWDGEFFDEIESFMNNKLN